ncbi:MAG: hypothetical protein ACJ74W_05065 [Pyrinomonadaceae bacterium]
MTSEELERAMQFILEQHAQLVVKVDNLASQVDGLATVQRRREMGADGDERARAARHRRIT